MPLVTAVAAAAVVASGLVAISSSTEVVAQGAGSGSLLLDETFQNGSVADPNWVALNSACLTGATTNPGPTQSNLGRCASVTGTPALQTPTYGRTPGYLQLTNNRYNQVGAVLYNQALPASGGVEATFQQWQYGGSTSFAGPAGADGIGFFLVNGATDLTSGGADGGSLGYAQRTTGITSATPSRAPGVHGGVLGVGLDVFGNFANDAEDRGNGCATPPPRRPGVGTGGYYAGGPGFPNVISVRGPGEGLAGYCWLSGTVTAPSTTPPLCTSSNWGNIPTPAACGTSTLTDAQRLYGGAVATNPNRDTMPPAGALRTVRVDVSPEGLVEVWIAYNSAGAPDFGTTPLVSYQLPYALPPTFKFGFSSSTGGSSAVHLIGHVTVKSIKPLPSINLEKVVDETQTQPDAYWAGATVPYKFVVTNTSPYTITNVRVTDPSADDPPGIDCPFDTLVPVPGVPSTMTCTGQHTITVDEAKSDTFTNHAMVTGTADGMTVDDTADETVPIEGSVGLSLVKAATIDGAPAPPAVAKLGDTVEYTYTVTNTGNTPLTNVHINDTAVGTFDCGDGYLPPGVGSTLMCTRDHVVDQADIDAGHVYNSATATGTSPDGPIDSSPDEVDIGTDSHPGPLHLDKSGSLPDVPPGQPVVAGDVVHYTFTVTNQGNVTLYNLAIDERLAGVSGVVCDAYTLGPFGTTTAPSATTTCMGTYVLSQQDVDRGSLTNVATATGETPPDYEPGPGETVESNDATDTVTFKAYPALALRKLAAVHGTGPDGAVKAGDTITYTYLVRNTGNVTVHHLVVTDNLPGLSNIACRTYTLFPQPPHNQTTCTAYYTVTQRDIERGDVHNVASVTGTDPMGNEVPPAYADRTVELPYSASLSLEKQGRITAPNSDGLNAAGATITYTYTLENTGTVVLRSLDVIDHLPGLSAITCGDYTLKPAQTTTCTATYTVRQSDVDRGRVDNTAVASASSSRGQVQSNEDEATVPLDQVRSLSLTKDGSVKGTGPDAMVLAGDTITYRYTVTNTGTVTVRTLRITDSLRPLSPITCADSTLVPKQTTLCTATYTVRQADLDNGRVVNTAIAWGLGPRGAVVVSNFAHHRVPLTQLPALTLEKTATLTRTAGTLETDGDVTVPEVGDKILYTYEAKNTGNVTITQIAIDDPLPGLVPSSPDCDLTTLRPGQSTTCRAEYTLTQADFDRGEVLNVATASGQGANGEPVRSPQARAKVVLTRTPVLTLTKTGELDRTDSSVPAVPGDTVTYTYELLNNGNVTLTASAVDDNVLGHIDCLSDPLQPGDTTTCTATYTLTQDDIDAGQVVNTATANATTMQNEPVVSNPDTEIVPLEAAPSLVLTKTAVPNGLSAGDTIDYQYEVTNTGNVDLSDLSVTDNKITSPSAVTCRDTALAAGQTTTCTATYKITAADVSAGHVTNSARASGTDPSGGRVFSPRRSTSVPIPTTPPTTVPPTTVPPTTVPPITTPPTVPPPTPSPSLTVEKSGLLQTAGPEPRPGGTIAYSYVVTNTGNVELTKLAVHDSLTGLSAITCPATSLAPGDSTTCTATYALTQADIDAGHVLNTAFATGSPPGGGTTTSPPSNAEVTVPRFHELSLVKTATPSRTPAVAGTTVTYHYTVTNTGNTTVKNIKVTDMLPGLSAVSCPATTVGPGQSMMCSATYVVTQADVDNSSLVNVATATGTGPDGSDVDSPPGLATVALDKTPAYRRSSRGCSAPDRSSPAA